jgi:4-pyridoxate dehydrogenase
MALMAAAKDFDYIIVGAGSAGCVLAERLSSDAVVRVLLLEAGGWDWHPFLRVPLGVGRVWGFGRFDWVFQTEPEHDAGGRRIETARGKVIGGSNSINAMGYVRGHRGDYDRWASCGMPDWSYAAVLPYFKKSETWEDGETPHRGGSGPVYVRRTKAGDPLYDAYIEAGVHAGHPFTDDYNGQQQHGFGWAQWTIRRGLRDSTARAYLHPARVRRNLTIKTGVLAHRVLIEHGRATGVEFRRGGLGETAHAAREVILCAGAINTPQLLMLSGIGDPDHLRAFGIKVTAPMPSVGRNLQDHYAAGLAHERREAGPFLAGTRADRLAFNFARAYLAGTGPATDVPSGFMAFVKTDPSLTMPDIQLLFRAGASNAGPWFPGLKSPWRDAFVCRPILLRPASRGRVSLRAADPAAPVRIQQNFLSDGRDLPVLRAGLKLLREVAAQPSLTRFCGRETGPGADHKTDAELDSYIRGTGGTAHHPCGTCRMGVDPEAVVNPNLQVNGIAGLRVADASVMPDIVGGNINATVIMIAEKAADMIRGVDPKANVTAPTY